MIMAGYEFLGEASVQDGLPPRARCGTPRAGRCPSPWATASIPWRWWSSSAPTPCASPSSRPRRSERTSTWIPRTWRRRSPPGGTSPTRSGTPGRFTLMRWGTIPSGPSPRWGRIWSCRTGGSSPAFQEPPTASPRSWRSSGSTTWPRRPTTSSGAKLADWYLELVKPRLRDDAEDGTAGRPPVPRSSRSWTEPSGSSIPSCPSSRRSSGRAPLAQGRGPARGSHRGSLAGARRVAARRRGGASHGVVPGTHRRDPSPP